MPSATTLMERSRQRLISDFTIDLQSASVANSRTNEPSILMLSGESFRRHVSDAAVSQSAYCRKPLRRFLRFTREASLMAQNAFPDILAVLLVPPCLSMEVRQLIRIKGDN